LCGLATQIVESTNLISHGLDDEKRGDEASDEDSSTRWHVPATGFFFSVSP
jgi:hypothetical protein